MFFFSVIKSLKGVSICKYWRSDKKKKYLHLILLKGQWRQKWDADRSRNLNLYWMLSSLFHWAMLFVLGLEHVRGQRVSIMETCMADLLQCTQMKSDHACNMKTWCVSQQPSRNTNQISPRAPGWVIHQFFSPTVSNTDVLSSRKQVTFYLLHVRPRIAFD